MANKSVFKSAPKGKVPPAATHKNKAGGKAYKLGDKAALAQYAATGTFNDAFYSKGEDTLEEVLAILPNVTPEFIGKVALYARDQGRMKDMPSLLAAHLTTRGDEGRKVLRSIFPLVIDNGRMFRNFVQMIRSGAVGRKSFGTAPKKIAQSWFNNRTCEAIFKQSTGNDPSIADAIKLVRPTDQGSPERKAFYQYLLDREYDFDSLPPLVKEYEIFKKAKFAKETEKLPLPRVPWEMLVGLPLNNDEWSMLAQQASWTQLRMNLNTFARHGVFKNDTVARLLAAKLADKEQVLKAKPFPYQLMTAYLFTSESGTEAVPRVIRNALHTALDFSVETVPSIEGPAHALIDVSGSMQSPVTGYQANGTSSKATCVQAAALLGSCFMKKNPESSIIAYSDNAITNHGCVPQDSVLTNADKLARLGGGGTNLGAAFRELNKKKAKGDLVVVCSDMETWMDESTVRRGYSSWITESTVSAQAWSEYKSRNPKAKLVCINLAAGNSCQVASNTDVLNMGGFSDTIWEVVKSFVEGTPSADHWVSLIEAIKLPDAA